MNREDAVKSAQEDLDKKARLEPIQRDLHEVFGHKPENVAAPSHKSDLHEAAQRDMDEMFGHKVVNKQLKESDLRKSMQRDVDVILGVSSGEARIKQLKESGALKTDSARDIDIDIACVDLKEARYNDEGESLENVILIESGTNKEKGRHYPESTIREAAPNFKDLKMYINHPTKTEERDRPERNLKDWVSTIIESSYLDGKVIAKVVVHDPWLKGRLKDPIARKHIGLSILTGGRSRLGKVDGQEMEIVEKIVFARKSGPVSVDWVTEAGARGRVAE